MGRTALFGSIGVSRVEFCLGLSYRQWGRGKCCQQCWVRQAGQVHLMISIVFDAGFGLLTLRFSSLISLPVLYSVLIWMFGPLVMMSLLMGQ